jgi:hypothetical protein
VPNVGLSQFSAQLIDAATGSHVLADRFDRSQEEIFAVQDQVVRMIVGTTAKGGPQDYMETCPDLQRDCLWTL